MIDQLITGLFGATGVVLSQAKTERWRRRACLFGLAAQPAWFYMAWTHEQYGIFGLTFIYTYGWWKGVWNNWVKPWAVERWRIRFAACKRDLFWHWTPYSRYVEHQTVWKNLDGCYVQQREFIFLVYKWQLHWVWRVKV